MRPQFQWRKISPGKSFTQKKGQIYFIKQIFFIKPIEAKNSICFASSVNCVNSCDCLNICDIYNTIVVIAQHPGQLVNLKLGGGEGVWMGGRVIFNSK